MSSASRIAEALEKFTQEFKAVLEELKNEEAGLSEEMIKHQELINKVTGDHYLKTYHEEGSDALQFWAYRCPAPIPVKEISEIERDKYIEFCKSFYDYKTNIEKLNEKLAAFDEEFSYLKIQMNQKLISYNLVLMLKPTWIVAESPNSEPLFMHGCTLESTSYDEKRQVVEYLNGQTRQHGAALAHPENQEPCILFALPTKDGIGRYTLENRKTKKRSGYYKSIIELLPIKLVPDVPRKEGFLEARKKKKNDSVE